MKLVGPPIFYIRFAATRSSLSGSNTSNYPNHSDLTFHIDLKIEWVALLLQSSSNAESNDLHDLSPTVSRYCWHYIPCSKFAEVDAPAHHIVHIFAAQYIGPSLDRWSNWRLCQICNMADSTQYRG